MFDGIVVKTADVDIEMIGMRSGAIERVNTANPTENMFSSSCIKRIGGQNIFPTEQGKTFRRHNEVQKSLLFTDRTVAIRCFVFVNGDTEADSSAVTAAKVGNKCCRPCVLAADRINELTI